MKIHDMLRKHIPLAQDGDQISIDAIQGVILCIIRNPASPSYLTTRMGEALLAAADEDETVQQSLDEWFHTAVAARERDREQPTVLQQRRWRVEEAYCRMRQGASYYALHPTELAADGWTLGRLQSLFMDRLVIEPQWLKYYGFEQVSPQVDPTLWLHHYKDADDTPAAITHFFGSFTYVGGVRFEFRTCGEMLTLLYLIHGMQYVLENENPWHKESTDAADPAE